MSTKAIGVLQRTGSYWSGQASRYDRWGDLAHGRPEYRRAWRDALAVLIGETGVGGRSLRVLDIGTGTAELALVLAELGHRVTAVDLAPGMLERARANIAEARSGTLPGTIELVRAAADQLPISTGEVDVVVNRMVFWTLPDPVAALSEWRRVLGTTGRIVVIDALHFAQPMATAARIRHQVGQLYWNTLSHLDRSRSSDSALPNRDRPATPGETWQSVHEPAELFAAAGLAGVRMGWLDEVARAHRRTAPLRWRLTGLLPRFFTLSWDVQA